MLAAWAGNLVRQIAALPQSVYFLENAMKLTHFFTLAELILLVALWLAGVPPSSLVIVFLLMSINGAFQLWVRGNVKWNENINADSIKKKMPMWAYSSISVTGLLAIAIYVSKITYGV